MKSAGGNLDKALRVIGWGTIAALLVTPLIAMQFSDEVNWSASDFLFAGLILGGAGLVCELVARRSSDWAYRIGAGLAVAACVGLVWVTGAVGIIGSEAEPANLLYFGVIALAALGAVAVRFEAVGLARVMGLAGVAQVLIGAVALTAGWGRTDPSWPMDIIGATAMFAVMWLMSAGLFRMAGRGGKS